MEFVIKVLIVGTGVERGIPKLEPLTVIPLSPFLSCLTLLTNDNLI